MTHRDPLAFAEDALCQQVDYGIFFVDVGGDSRDAKAVCRRCDAITACLAYALTNDVDGVWGGTTYRERSALHRFGHKVPDERVLICVTCHTQFHGNYRRKYCDPCRVAATRAAVARWRKRAA